MYSWTCEGDNMKIILISLMVRRLEVICVVWYNFLGVVYREVYRSRKNLIGF